jgi:peptidoglycan/LPS O-acetylase OafA/YrhL
MLSGFILAYNYKGQIETRSHAIRFWEARYARIWPAYLFSLLCSSIPISNIPPFPIAIATIFMVQAWDPFRAQCGYWNMVCWSLSVEALFYLLFPWLQRGIEKLGTYSLMAFGIFIGAIGILCNTPNHIMSLRYSGPFFYVIVPIVHLPEFIAGLVLGNLFLVSEVSRLEKRKGQIAGDGSDAKTSRFRLPWITTLGFFSSILVLAITRSRWESLAIATFSLLLYGLATERSPLSRFLSTPALILGGEISYSMYLLRTPLHGWLALSPVLSANRIVDLLYIPLGLIPLSLFSYYVIEGPSRRGLRRTFARVHGKQQPR